MRILKRQRPLRRFARTFLRVEWLEERTLLANSNLPALLLLDPSSSGALNVSGNGNVLVTGGGSAVVDSANPQAAKVSGNGRVSAADLYFTGSPGFAITGSASLQGVVHSGAAPLADPLAGLPVPQLPATTFAAVNCSGNTSLTLAPGTYLGGIEVSGNGSVKLLPGIYYLKGGGFAVSGNGSVTGDGVMIYNDAQASGDAISFSGNGNLHLTPPTGGTYQDITLFQNPTASTPINVTGNGRMTFVGTIYAPRATLNATGNGVLIAAGNPSGINQYIFYDLNVTGNGSVQEDAGYNQDLTLTIQVTPSPTVLPGGTLATNVAASIVEGSTRPGALVDLETGNDDLFDEGHTTADASGHYVFPVTLTEGPNSLQVRATARFDQHLIASTQVALDTKPPTVAITSPAPGLLTNHNPTVAGQVTDGLAGVASLQAALDSGPLTAVSFDAAGNFSLETALPLDQSADGKHTVHLRAIDRVGNVSALSDVTFTLDTVPPVVTITGPAPGLVTNGNITVTGRATDDRTGVATLQAAIDGGPFAAVYFDASGNFSLATAFPLDHSADGDHTVRLRATDRAGNVSSPADVSFTLDTVRPEVTVTQPASGLPFNHNITVTGDARDDRSGVVLLQAALDLGPLTAVPFDSAGHFSLTTTLALDHTADGVHTVHLRATDGAGNVSALADLSFTLDTVAPTVTLTSPAQGLTTDDNVTITGLVADERSGVASLRAAVDAGSFADVVFDASGNFSFTTAFTLDGMADGLHTVHFVAADRAGNVSGLTDYSFDLEACLPWEQFGDWTAGESGGSATGHGTVDVPHCGAVLHEGDSFNVTLRHTFIVPDPPSVLTFHFSNLSFDVSSQGRIKDAFEAALIDADGRPLVHTIANSRDAFINVSEGQPAALGADTVADGQTVTVDLTHLFAGETVTLVFRLVNNDGDVNTSVQLDSVQITGAAGPVGSGNQPPTEGTNPSQEPIDFNHLADVSGSVQGVYGRTSFSEGSEILYADLGVVNVGQYLVHGPLLVGVAHVSDPSVRVRGADGVTPGGVPYYDFTNLVSGAALLAGQSTGSRSLAFYDPARVPFTYDLVILSQLNRPPVFTTEPDVEALVGRSYTYAAAATDPDGDALTFSLVAGPAGMSVDAASGRVTWSPTAGDRGAQDVTLRVEDGHGGSAEQHYVLAVIDAPPNRPPVFTSVPVVSAAINTTYSYQAAASDPDNDPLTFSIAAGPENMAIDPVSGLVTWTPSGNSTTERFHVSDTRFDPPNWTATKLSDSTPSPGQTSITTSEVLTAGHPGSYQAVVESLAGPGTASFANLFAPGAYSPQQSGGIATVDFSFDVKVAASYQTGTSPWGVVTGDLNGDGKLDLIAANSGGNSISVLLGDGAGAFSPRTDYLVGIEPFAVALGDFNGDGRLDVVAVNRGANTVSVLLGNGNGTFAPKTDFSVGRGPEGVAVGDVNGDSRLDIVTTDRSDADVSVLLGRGDGTFAPRQQFTTAGAPSGVVLGDLNGDGRLDIGTGNFAGSKSVSVLLGNGDGTFGPKTDYATPASPGPVALGDLNGDGNLDLVSGNIGSAAPGDTAIGVSVFLGRGDGTFGPRTDLATAGRPAGVALGDLNGDGKLDLVSANRETGAVSTTASQSVSVWLGRGDGTFALPRTDFAIGDISTSVALADLDADGNLDIAAPLTSLNKVSLLFGDGDGTFATEGSTFQPILVQAGSYYTTTKGSISTGGAWQHFAASNLISSNFTRLTGMGPLNPDFSATAPAIQLGYLLTSTTTSGPARAFAAGIDNWSASITRVAGGFPQDVPIALTVSDGRGGTATQSFVVEMAQATGNHPPVIVSTPMTTAVPGQTYTYPVQAIDADNDPLTYSLDLAPDGMTINTSAGAIVWQVPRDDPTYRFTITMGSSNRDDGRGVATDSLGNVYLTGFVSGTVDFDPGPGVANLTPAAQSVAYVAKYSPAGSLIWLRSIQGTGNSSGNSIVVDPADNVFISGGFSGNADFDPGPGQFVIPDPGRGAAYVWKLDANGNFLWARATGGTPDQIAGAGLAVDPLGNVVLIDNFFGTIDVDPSAGVLNFTSVDRRPVDGSSNPGLDLFVLKLAADGTFLWARHLGNSTGFVDAESRQVAMDDSGNVLISGRFQFTIDFDPGPGSQLLSSNSQSEDIFVLKLDAGGNFVWVRQIGGPTADRGRGIDVDASGNVALTSIFTGAVDYDPGSGVTLLPDLTAGYDGGVVKLDANGNFLWAAAFPGAGGDAAYSLAFDPNGNVIADGSFTGIRDFDPGPGVVNLDGGAFRWYTVKLDPNRHLIWAQASGGSQLAVDCWGHIYSTSYFQGTYDFDPGPATNQVTSTAGSIDIFLTEITGAPSCPKVTVHVEDGRGGSDEQRFTIDVASPRDVDLTVTEVNPDALVFDGQQLTVSGAISATIKNRGSQSVLDPFDVLFFEDRNDNSAYDPGVDKVLGTATVAAPLAAGAIATTTTQLDGTVLFSGNRIWALADSGQAVRETDETNNLGVHLCEFVTPSGQSSPAADLTASYVRAVQAGPDVTYTARIGNGGSILAPAGINVAFYDGDPHHGGVLRGVAQTITQLKPSQYEDVSLTVSGTFFGNVWVVADDPSSTSGGAYEFSTFDVPGAFDTSPYGINSAGQIVGEAHLSGLSNSTAFLLNGGVFSTFAIPGAVRTGAWDVNDRGQIAGFWYDGNRFHGLLTTTAAFGTTTAIDVPGAFSTISQGINDAGEIVGYYDFGGTAHHGFWRSAGGSYATIDYPGASASEAHGNNDSGQIVGSWQDGTGKYHAWIRDAAGQFTTFDAPLATSTEALDVNDAGQIVGYFRDGSGHTHGFLRDAAGVLTVLDVPGSIDTDTRSINDAGKIVGFWHDPAGPYHGFVATPVGKVRECDEDNNFYHVVVPGTGEIRGTKFNDLNGNGVRNTIEEYIYWSTAGEPPSGGPNSTIKRAHLDGTGVETVLSNPVSGRFQGVAVDVLNGHLFSGDASYLFRANLDGSGRTNLVALATGGGNSVTDVELDSLHGKVYWAEFTGKPRIRRANLDGTGAETVISLDFPGGLEGIALDPQAGKIYYAVHQFTSTIYVANMDGSGQSTFKTLPLNSEPFDVEVDSATGKLYWNEYGTDLVQKANLDGTGGIELVYASSVPIDNGIHFDSVNQKLYFAGTAIPGFGQPVDLNRINPDGTGFQFFLRDNGRFNYMDVAHIPEPGLAGWTIYLDDNLNGRRDPGERFTTTDVNGNYSFPNLAVGTYAVAEEQQSGWVQTAPVGGTYTVTVASGQIISGEDFGNKQSTEPAVNHPPTFNSPAPAAATVGQLLSYRATASDPDRDPLTYDLVLKPAGMAVDPTTGIVVWVPTADEEGTQDVILRVQDGRGGIDLQSFQIVVGRANSTPVITSAPHGPAVVATPYQYQVLAQDADGDPITFRLDSAPAGMTINAATGLIAWTPASGQVGSQHVAVTASDNHGAATTQSFDLPVVATAPNDPPRITSTPRGSIRIGDHYLYAVLATDPNGDPLTFSLPTAPAGMTIGAAGLVEWTPAAAQLGGNPVQVLVADGRGGFATQTFSINVTTQASNQPPAITSTPPFTATVGRLYPYDPTGSDPDSDPLTWSLDAGPAGMSIDAARGSLRWTPTADQLGAQNVILRVVDGQGGFATQTFAITVRAVNVPPNIVSTPPTQAAVGAGYAYAVEAIDADGDVLAFSLTAAPAGMTIDTATGSIQWTPTKPQVGPQNVAVRVEDGQGGFGTQTWTVVVSATALNQPPVITSVPGVTATLGQAYQYPVTAVDPEGQTVLFSLRAAPAGMAIDPIGGLIQWTPAAAQTGLQTVTVAAIDPQGAAGLQTFTLAVASLNHSPTISSQPVQVVTAGLPYRYDVRATDPDGDPLSYRLDSAPAGMALDTLGRITWAPAIADIGTRRIAVTVSDNHGAEITQTYDLAVVADTQTPRVSLLVSGNPVEVGSLVTFVVSATDNVGVQSLGLTLNGSPVPLDASGRVTLRAEPAGEYAVRASATDAAGNTGLATTTLSVLDTSDVTAPEVSISSPLPDKVVTAPVDVVGTAADDNLLFYKLEVAPVAGGPFSEVFRGTTSVLNGVLGKFDPSGLADDAYTLRLTAVDAGGNTSVVDQTINVAGDLKLGNFTLSFTDLTIPVSGIPITVSRTYDTLTAGQNGELGYGWRLEFRDTNLRTSLAPSGAEDLGVYTPFRDHARVYVTLPGGKREGFTFTPRVQSVFGVVAFYHPAFTADPGVTDRLSVPDYTLVRDAFGDYYGLVNGGSLAYNPADDLNFGGRYFLTTRDGVAYTIDATTGELTTVSDAHGNKLTFSDAAIDSSTGQRVTFGRDPQGRITSVTDPTGAQVHYAYDAHGDLVSVTDREGNVTRFVYDAPRPHYLTQVIDPLGRTGVRTEYDSQGRLIQLLDAAGKAVQLAYDPDHSTETVRDALGNPTTFEYDLRGNVVSEVNAIGGITRRIYDDNNDLLSETDPLGRTVAYTYDGDGNVLSQSDALGNVTRNTYVTMTPGFFALIAGARPVSLLLTTTDPLGDTTSNAYDGAGDLVTTTDAAGNATRYTYDAAGNQLSITDAAGNVSRFEYDGAGRLRRQTDALGHQTDYTYDASGNPLTQTTTLTTPSGVRILTTATAYDANGRSTAVTDAEGNVTHTEYDALGHQTATVDARGLRTEYRYDERGQLVQMLFADGTSASLAYDDAGRRISSTDRAGRVTRFQYDALGRLVATIEPDATPADLTDNPRTRTEYDAAGEVTAQIDERGDRTEFVYDTDGRQTVVRNALGQETHTAYDAAGRTVAATDALGHTTQFVLDALGRQVATDFADGTTTARAYDALGRDIRETDQNGRTTAYEYDSLGRLTAVVDALAQRTEYGYDEAGNLVSQKDANGHVTRYEYDGLGRRTATVLPLGERSTTTYDAAGNVASTTDFNGATIRFDYDSNNRLTAQHFPDGTSVTFTYTPSGQRATTTDFRGMTTYAYDERDRLVSRTDPDGTRIAYTYDAAGNRTSVTILAGTTAYTFDALNRVETVIDQSLGVTRYTYDADGNLLRTDVSNGTVEKQTYDALNHLTFLENDGPSGVISSYRYTLDAAGNRIAVVEDTGRRVDYGYDALYRLTREALVDAVFGNRTIDYTYDPVGNRLTRNDSAEGLTLSTYDADDHLLTEDLAGQIARYTYDANGNTLSKVKSATDEVFYRWDVQNRLVEADVTDASGTSHTFNQYDADGIRVAQGVDGQETRFLIDANRPYAQVLMEYRPSGLIVASYVYGNSLILQDRGGVRSNYSRDGLGSTRALTDASGVVTDRYAYDAFGRTFGQSGRTTNLYLFAGEQRDAKTGLDYLRARYLNVSTGRFYGRDRFAGVLPIPVSRHPYLYGHANPANLTDPSGRTSLVEAVTTEVIAGIVAQLTLGRIIAGASLLAHTGPIKWDATLITVSVGSLFGGILHATSECYRGRKATGNWLLLGREFDYGDTEGPGLSFELDLIDSLFSDENSQIPSGRFRVGDLTVEAGKTDLFTPSPFGINRWALSGGFAMATVQASLFVGGLGISGILIGFGRGELETPIGIGGYSAGVSASLVVGVSIPGHWIPSNC